MSQVELDANAGILWPTLLRPRCSFASLGLDGDLRVRGARKLSDGGRPVPARPTYVDSGSHGGVNWK